MTAKYIGTCFWRGRKCDVIEITDKETTVKPFGLTAAIRLPSSQVKGLSIYAI